MEANFNIRKWIRNNNELKDKLEIIESQENVHNSELLQKCSIEKIETDDNCSITNRKVLGIEWDEQNDILKLGIEWDEQNDILKLGIEWDEQNDILKLGIEWDEQNDILKLGIEWDEQNDILKLGIEWDEQNDILKLGIREIFGKVTEISPTQRNILKVIASVYDPIGIPQPIIIKLKLLQYTPDNSNLQGTDENGSS